MTEPMRPPQSFRITLSLNAAFPRLDQVLLEALRGQERNQALKRISRKAFKDLFNKKRIQIKGQNALPSSSLARGVTYVDVLGYEEEEPASF